MKKLIISMVSTVMMIGAGVAFRSNQDVSVPTVEKSSQETVSVEKKKSKVSKHEDVDKEESKTDEIQVKEENTASKSDSKKEIVSSSTKKQNNQSNDNSKSSVKSDTKVNDSNNNNSSTKENLEQTTTSTEETVEPTPAPETVQPGYACPGGVDQNVSCDVILDSNFYYATYGSMSEAKSAGEYYLNDVMYIGNAEITNYSVQPVYRNDHSIAYYGLSLWSNGILIQ